MYGGALPDELKSVGGTFCGSGIAPPGGKAGCCRPDG